MTPKKCPDCGRPISWRNAALQCLDCGREYCKECPDYAHGRFEVRCPECGCESARPLRDTDDAGPTVPPLGRARRRWGGRRWRSLRNLPSGPRRHRPRRANPPDSAPTDGASENDPPDPRGKAENNPERSDQTSARRRFPFTF